MAMNDKDILEAYNHRLKEAMPAGDTLHKAVAKAFGFYSGSGQWAEEDVQKLKNERRPALTVNKVKPVVDTVTGSEITSRFSQKFLPRTPEDEQAAQNITETVRYIRDQVNAEFEESMAFADAAKVGLGCCEIWNDEETDPEGIQRIERVNLFELYPDPGARKTNLLDAEYVIRRKGVGKKFFIAQWPDHANLSDSDKPEATMGPVLVAPATGRDAYDSEGDKLGANKSKNKVLVTEYNWFEREPRWTSDDPFTGNTVEFEKEDEARQYQAEQMAVLTQMLQSGMMQQGQVPAVPQVVKQLRKVYYRGFFCGPNLLEWGRSPLQKTGFPYKFISCFEDLTEEETTWFGIIRNAMGAQEAYNKFISQMIHLVSVQSKGGLIYETGAFVDPQRARRDWADPASMVEVAPGALDRIRNTDGPRYPSGLDSFVRLMDESMSATTNVNLNYMGGAAEDLRRTATSVVHAIQRQGMVTLAPLFDSLRLFRKEMGKSLQEMIALHWKDGRLIRLNNNQFAPFIKDWATNTYDIVVDEVPTSSNQQMETWNALTQTNKSMELLIQMGVMTPDIVADIVPNLPSEIRQRMKQNFAMQQQAQRQAEQQMAAAPQEGAPVQ